MSIFRKGVLMAAVGVLAAIAVAAAPAGASPGSSDDVDPQAQVGGIAYIYRPGQASAPPEDCRARTSPNGGRVYICSAYALDPLDPPTNQTAYGYFRGTADAGTVAWVIRDGREFAISYHPDFRGIFANVKDVRFRACKAGVCGAYS